MAAGKPAASYLRRIDISVWENNYHVLLTLQINKPAIKKIKKAGFFQTPLIIAVANLTY